MIGKFTKSALVKMGNSDASGKRASVGVVNNDHAQLRNFVTGISKDTNQLHAMRVGTESGYARAVKRKI